MHKVTLIGLIMACMATGCGVSATAKTSEPTPIPVSPKTTPIVIPSPSPSSPVPSNLDTTGVAKNNQPKPEPKTETKSVAVSNNGYTSNPNTRRYATIELVAGYNYANLYAKADDKSEVLRKLNYGTLVFLTGITSGNYRQAVTVDENIAGWLIIR
jgi:hypothetical protein